MSWGVSESYIRNGLAAAAAERDGVGVGLPLAAGVALLVAAGPGFVAGPVACADGEVVLWCAEAASWLGRPDTRWPLLAWFISASRACRPAGLAGGDAAKATLVEIAARAVALAAATPRVSLVGPCRRLRRDLLLATPLETSLAMPRATSLMLWSRPWFGLRRCRPEL
jgi:hypothetical protein